MAYDYLKDGTPFVADELNSRFKSETFNLNTVVPEEIKSGAFGPQHLPSLVGNAGASLSKMFRKNSVTTQFTRRLASDSAHVVAELTLTDADQIDETKANAVIVLINFQLNRIEYNGTEFGDLSLPTNRNPVEDTAVLRVEVEFITSTGVYVVIPQATRVISPGMTMTNSGLSKNTSGDFMSSLTKDKLSHKDVAIRTVLKPGNLGIYGIRVRILASTYGLVGAADWDIYTDKHNITLIPIQAKLVET